MAYCITSAGHEIDYQCFAKSHVDSLSNPLEYFFVLYGLDRHIIPFTYEQMDIMCVLITEDYDLGYFELSALERDYFYEFKRDLEDYYM